MQILKKRLSIHRSGRVLRNLWTEFLKMSESCNELDATKLRTLSSFMENILESDTQIPISTDAIFAELSVIITGLLDVAHRSALQLCHKDREIDPTDKSTLTEAMRKSLLVAELILRERRNRAQMTNTPDIVSRILGILKNVDCIEDKIFALTIIGHIVKHDASREEFCGLNGFHCVIAAVEEIDLCDKFAREKVTGHVLNVLQECISADCSFHSTSPSCSSIRDNSGVNKKDADSPISTLSPKCSKTGGDCDNLQGRTHDSTFQSTRPMDINAEGEVNESSFSLSFAAQGLNMAFSVVNDIMRYAPLSTSWLEKMQNSHKSDAKCEIGEFEDDRSRLHQSGLLVSPVGLQMEQSRLQSIELVSDEADDSNGFVQSGNDNYLMESIISQGVADWLVRLLEAVPEAQISQLQQHPSCVFCLVKAFLLHHSRAQKWFAKHGGYSALSTAIIALCKRGSPNEMADGLLSCRECFSKRGGVGLESAKPKRSVDNSTDDWDTLIGSNARLLSIATSIVFDRDITHLAAASADYQQTRPTGKTFTVENIPMLKIISSWIGHSDRRVSHFGIITVNALLRLNPLTAVAFKFVGGSTILSSLIIDTALGRNMTVVPHCLEEKYASASTSPGKSPDSLSCSPPSSVGVLPTRLSEENTTLLPSIHRNQPEQSGSNSPMSRLVQESSSRVNDSVLGYGLLVGDGPSQTDALQLLLNSIRVLARVAVITSSSSSSELALLVLIVKKLGKSVYSLCKISTLWRTGRFANQSHAAVNDRFSLHRTDQCVCSNCEMEPAVYECTHQSCMSDGLHGLCRECDRVFHKAVTKKAHIRLPIQQIQDYDTVAATHLHSNLCSLLEDDCEAMSFGYESEVPRLYVRNSRWSVDAYGEYVANVMILLLHYIQKLIDDKRARNIDVDTAMFSPILQNLRLMLTSFDAIPNPDPVKKYALFASLNVTNEIITNEVIGSSGISASSLESIETSEEPPEDTQIRPQRLCLSLMLHIVSRQFVESRSELRSLPSELSSAKSHSHLFLRSFRAMGGECCLALMISESARFSLTNCDKQFAVWTLREAIVSTYQSDPVVAQSLLRWLVWLLGCPASSSKVPISASQVKVGSLENVIIDRETFLQSQVDGIAYALPPSGRPVITCQIRLFIIQELRALLGGDDWIPVWGSSLPHVIQNKLCGINRLSSQSDIPKHESDSLYFRIPLSKKQIQSHMSQLAVIEILVSILTGDLASPLAKFALLQQHHKAPSDTQEVLVEEVNALEWWSALAALSSVVVDNDIAKDSLDAVIGIVSFARILIPCIEHPLAAEKDVASALNSLLIELSVRGGRWFAPSRPFISWTKLPASSGSNIVKPMSAATHQSAFLEKLMSPVTQLGPRGNSQYPSISDLSPQYFAKTDMVLNALQCISPTVMYQSLRASKDEVAPPLGRYLRSASGSACGGFNGFDDRVRQDSSVNADPPMDYGDDTSTGRGSFSVHSMRGFPHSYSLSAFPTPPPSVAGGERTCDDVSIYMGRLGKGVNAGDTRSDYCGEYLPFLAGLNWGLAHMESVLLGVVYEFMLHQDERNIEATSKRRTDGDGFDDMTHTDCDPLLMSLRQHSVEQYLHSYLVPTTVAHWEPQFSKLCFYGMESAELLFSLAVVLKSGQQLIFLNALSHIIDGNQANIRLLSTKNFVLRVARLLFSNDDVPRGQFCHILSQLLRQQISHDTLRVLVRRAEMVHGVNVKDIIRKDPYLPANGAKRCALDSMTSDIDDSGCQILYMLGVAVENPEPAVFTHFTQELPFTSGIQLPPMDRLPSESIGFSIVTWVRIGGLGNIPISVLSQHTVQCLNDGVSNGSVFSMIIFFRVVYRTGLNAKDPDNASVASGGIPDSQGADDVLKKRILQLCITYRRNHNPTDDCVDDSSEESIVGLNGNIITSFVGYFTPDVIIDYDWSEMASWHLLSISFSSSGVSCVVDSRMVPVLYWTALGYANLSSDVDSLERKEVHLPPIVKYPVVHKDQYFCGCLGGILFEYEYFLKALEKLSSASSCSNFSNKALQDKILREFEFLQCYVETIRGFSGCIGAFQMLEGVVDTDTLSSIFQSGSISGIPVIPSFRKLFTLVAEEAVHQDSMRAATSENVGNTPVASIYTGCQVDISADRGRLVSRRSSEILHGGEATVIFGTTRRVSRSLSPISLSRTVDLAATASRDESAMTRPRNDASHVTVQNDSRSAISTNHQSTSLVSDLLTMFSGQPKDGEKFHQNTTSLIHGSVTVCQTKSISSIMAILGGMELWFPLLVIDRPHQVATLRIMASIFISLQSGPDQNSISSAVDVILYCLHSTPGLVSQSSIQVLFDLTCSPRGYYTKSLPSTKVPERIRRIEYLVLAVHTAVASPQHIELAKSTMEWLIELCDESVENISRILKHFELTPFLILLSLWESCKELQSLEELPFCFNNGKKELVVQFQKTPSDRHLKSRRPGFERRSLVKLPQNVQVTVSRFFKLILTGSQGELPALAIPLAASTPTGFEVSHMTSLMGFIQSFARYNFTEISDIRDRITTQSPNEDRSHNASEDRQTSYSERLFSISSSLHALQMALDCFIDACEGPLFGTIINMAKAALPVNGLWYLILDLLGCSHNTIKARAVKLLGFSLSTNDGAVDPRLVIQFEKISGFGSVAAKLVCNLSGDSEVIIDCLLSIFFWERGQKGSGQLVEDEASLRCDSDISGNGEYKDEKLHGKSKCNIEDLGVGSERHEKGPPNAMPIMSSSSRHRVHKYEMIALPQVLQPILALLQHEISHERVQFAMSTIECCLSQDMPFDESCDNSMRATRNVEVLCSQRDWLLWICECLLYYQRRSMQSDLGDSNFFSMSEGESVSGLDSGDESIEGCRPIGAHHPSNCVKTLSSFRSMNQNPLEKFADPLFSLVRTALAVDVTGKPNSSRKFYDIFRLTDVLSKPESQSILVSILFDLLEAFESHPLHTSSERSLYILRNLSSFLDQVLEKCETSIEFCVKAVHVINSMSYRAAPDLRSKIKDTMLPEVRNAYLTRCLVDRREDIWSRISCLAELHSSVLNLIVSGTPTRTLSDQHVVLLFVELFVEATACYADTVSDRDGLFGDGIEEVLNLEMAALVLIQNCSQSSVECRKTLEKLLASEFADSQRLILFDAFSNSFGNSVESPQCMSPIEDHSGTASNQRSSWWGYWYVDSSASASTSGSGAREESSVVVPATGPGGHHADSVRDIEKGGDGEVSDILSECATRKSAVEDIDTSSKFLEWINSDEQRACLDVLKFKVAKIIPSVYQKTDKIQEKIIQRRSRHLRQLQDKNQKEKLLIARSIQDLLDKAYSSNEKIVKKFERDTSKWVNAMMERIYKGSVEFRRGLELADEEEHRILLSPEARCAKEQQIQGSCDQTRIPSSPQFRLEWALENIVKGIDGIG